MLAEAGVGLGPFSIARRGETLDGGAILLRLLDVAAAYVHEARTLTPATPGLALLGRIRGTGPGVSFSKLIQTLRETFPIPLQAPFEDSPNVAGAVLSPRALLGLARTDAALLLRFGPNATDLPMHAHQHSDRLLYIVGGRGFFHVTPESVVDFSGEKTRSFAVRERDIVLFRAGTVHTFSTAREPLELLSYHAPFVSLNDPRQYVIPARRQYPGQERASAPAEIVIDAAWNRLT